MCMYVCVIPDGKFKFFITPDGIFSHAHIRIITRRNDLILTTTRRNYFILITTRRNALKYTITRRNNRPKKCEKDKPGGKTSTKIYGCLLQRAATFRRVFYRRRRAETLSAGLTIEEPPLLSYVRRRSC